MRMNRLLCAVAVPAMMLAVGACDNDKAVAPDNQLTATVSGTTGAVFSQPSDTTPVGSTAATIHGSVILITVTPSNGQPVDTSHTSPIAGARLSLSQRVNNNGTVTQVPYAQTTSDANGAFSFGEVPAGYYVLKADAPDGASYPGAQAYIATSVPDIAVEFRLVTGL